MSGNSAWRLLLALLLLIALGPRAHAQKLCEEEQCIFPEQRHVQVRGPHGIWGIPKDPTPPPRTVAVPECNGEVLNLSLDEAIRIALRNAEVIRVLGGSSGSTVYDPAITNTQVDVQRSAFDPTLSIDNFYNRSESYTPNIIPPGPDVGLDVFESDAYSLGATLSQRKVSGTQLTGSLSVTPTNTDPGGLLDPQTPTAINFGVVRPLLRGGDKCANLAPIVIARLDTEQSYYQLKDSVQELIRGVVEGYWSIVSAKVAVWSTKQQIEQLEFALNFFEAQQKVGRTNAGDTAQTQVSLANFRANLLAAEANLLNAEARLRNILGLPPVDANCFIPTTPPLTEQQRFNWKRLVSVAEHHRPDIIQLKLQIEEDEQRLIIAQNNALPTVNAVANRTTNGLAGTNPLTGANVSRFGASDVQVGLQVNLPLGLRADRANLRAAEISLSRDKALLAQQLHAVTHVVAQNVRNLDQFYRQYEAFKKVREAARTSLDLQLQQFRTGRITYLNVLQAVTDWGNAVSSEASALASYNIELASLQRQVGTIVEEHGVRFYEEHYSSRGPKCDCQCYGESMWTSENQQRYIAGEKPSEENFDLESQVPKSGNRKRRKYGEDDAKGDNDDDRADSDATSESDDERAERLRRSLGSPMKVEPLKVPEPDGPASELPRPSAEDGPAPVDPVEPPTRPEGRLPGDDIKELLEKIEDVTNPIKEQAAPADGSQAQPEYAPVQPASR